MIKYSEYKPFEDVLLKITDDLLVIKALYLQARKDEVRQEVIDGINAGILKSSDDVAQITKKQSPVYKAGLLN